MPIPADHKRIAVATNVVIFALRADRLELLLLRRRNPPFRGMWSLPGGLVGEDEGLDANAARKLREGTGLSGVFLEQLYTFSSPDRDPRERVITVGYYALVPEGRIVRRRMPDTGDVAWSALDDVPELAFDHGQIVEVARQRLAAKLGYSTIALQFLPETFTLSELQRVYEIILGESLDKRNFRKRMLALGHLDDARAVRRNGNHRPARLYRARHPDQVQIIR